MKPKIVELNDVLQVPKNVREAVLKVLDEHWPFVMIAKRPSGEWEDSCHYRLRQVSDEEVIGALQRMAYRILADDMSEDEGGAS